MARFLRDAVCGVQLTAVLLFGCGVLRAAAADFEELVDEYGQAKKEYKKATTPGPGARGQKGKQKRKGAAAKAKSLEQLLVRIAKSGKTGVRFVDKEYADPDPTIAAACARALLGSGHDGAVRAVAKGFSRSGKWPLSARVSVLDALAKSSDEAGIAFVIRTAKSSKPDDRALALGSLALRPENEAALEAIFAGLADGQAQVRSVALRALDAVRVKRMVPALFERIGRERDERVRSEVLDLLVKLTGVNLGFEVLDWRKWWEGAEPRFEFAREGTKSSGKTYVKTQYFGIEVASKRVAFLVDASNSMLGGARGGRPQGGKGKRQRTGNVGAPGSKIDVLKKELTRILRELPETTTINIIFFHKEVLPWKEKLHSLRGKGRDQAIRFVEDLKCAWGTNIYDSLELSLKDKRVDTIYLLSDGRPVGGTYDDPGDILREIGAINRLRGATIHCISFGQETAFLKDLAAQNGGVYRAINPGRQQRKNKQDKNDKKDQNGKNDKKNKQDRKNEQP